MTDELTYIEREAREDGEREYIEWCRTEGLCLECGGAGAIMTGWTALGFSPIYDTCEECGGTGEAPRLCPFCGQEAHAKACEELRRLLFDRARPLPMDGTDYHKFGEE